MALRLQGTRLTSLVQHLNRIESKLDTLIQQGKREMALLDGLTAAVAAQTTVDASVETLVSGLAAQISALLAAPTVDPVALQVLVTQMTTNNAALAAAVTANTPPAPAAPAVAPLK